MQNSSRNHHTTDARSRNAHPSEAPNPLEAYTFGKIQPQALPLEEAVLGALMLDREAVGMVSDLLHPEAFYLEAHQEIYRVIIRLHERQDPVDLLTVTEELRKTGQLDKVGGAFYIVELTNRVASAANIEYHARIIHQKFIHRECISLGAWLTKTGYEDNTDPFVMLDEAERRLFSISNGHGQQAPQDAAYLTGQMIKLVDEIQLRLKAGRTSGVSSGISEIDALTGGWQDTDLIILGARPGMGKTAFALCATAHAAKNGAPVGIISAEMAATQLLLRMVSMEAEIPGNRIKSKVLDDPEWEALGQAGQTISQLPIYIDDTPGISIMQLRSTARQWKKKYGIKLLIIDYIQLVTGNPAEKTANREQELAGISKKLKQLAKELNIPVIAISMLSRAVETRGGSKRPQLSDLRESGSIEADADIVAFLYRPEYYQILEDENGESLEGLAEFIVAKHRNGPLGSPRMQYQADITRFENIDPFSTNVANKLTNNVSSGTNPAFSSQFPATPPPHSIPRINERDIPF